MMTRMIDAEPKVPTRSRVYFDYLYLDDGREYLRPNCNWHRYGVMHFLLGLVPPSAWIFKKKITSSPTASDRVQQDPPGVYYLPA